MQRQPWILVAAAPVALAGALAIATPPAGPPSKHPASVLPVCETGATNVNEAAARPDGLLPRNRIVSFYGNPRSARMGVLGALPRDSVVVRLRRQAAQYARADTATPVIPALHLVTVVAQKSPGADRLYRARMPTILVEDVASLLDSDSMLLFLDIQPGASDVAREVRHYLSFLEQPRVHLALDPEFAMPPGVPPGSRIGSLDAGDINAVIDLLADLVERHSLPPKILIIHRFTERMLTGHDRIRLDSRVQVVITMDGFGRPALKRDSYRCFVAAQPVQFTGFKLFYQQDVPLMSAADVLALRPVPHIVIYQ